MGAGMGLAGAPATESIMSSLPPDRANIGSAVNDTTRELGGALGVAVIGSIMSSLYAAQLSGDVPAAARESLGAAVGLGGGLADVGARGVRARDGAGVARRRAGGRARGRDRLAPPPGPGRRARGARRGRVLIGHPLRVRRSRPLPRHALGSCTDPEASMSQQQRWNGRVAVDIRDAEPDWTPFLQPHAPEGAPNVLMIVWDDVGYGAMDVFGGPIETPTLRRIADSGLRYSNFHTTALCSPTRSSLLNGRNATSNNMACITEGAAGFPGFSARIPFENGLISEVLNERGWNTYAVGKWHLTPGEESTCPRGRAAGRWAAGSSASTASSAARRTSGIPTSSTTTTRRPAGHAGGGLPPLRGPRGQGHRVRPRRQVDRPEKPWFMYFAPGLRACAAPRRARSGRTATRAASTRATRRSAPEILAEQKRLGLLPRGRRALADQPARRAGRHRARRPALAPARRRPAVGLADTPTSSGCSRAWPRSTPASSPTPTTDRPPIDYLEESGQLENTIVVVVSDNGASGEGGPNGSLNENKFFNNVADDIEENLARHRRDRHAERSYNHYCNGWAWAFDTPFPYWKRFAGYEGGTADMCIVSWPQGIAAHGAIRDQYVHAVDIVPTLYELLGIRPARRPHGLHAEPDRGRELRRRRSPTTARPAARPSSSRCSASARIYHRGLARQHDAPADLRAGGTSSTDQLGALRPAPDRTQTRDLAAEHPDRLEELKGLWFYCAGMLNGPAARRPHGARVISSPRPQPSEPRGRYVYYPGTAEVPESVAVKSPPLVHDRGGRDVETPGFVAG